jgi:hypothetical protein
MALEVFIPPLLVFRVDPPLVFLAQTYILLSLVTIITVSVLKLPRIIYNCSESVVF